MRGEPPLTQVLAMASHPGKHRLEQPMTEPPLSGKLYGFAAA
jgi:hypothetical protein